MAIVLKATVAIIKKLLPVILVMACIGVKAQAPPFLERKVTLDFENQPIVNVFKAITDQTGVIFSYNSQQFNDKQKVTIAVNKKPLRVALDNLFQSTECAYKLNKQYVIIKCGVKKNQPKKSTYIISGYLVSATDSGKITNASIFVKTTRQSVLSDSFGYFQLTASKAEIPLQLSIAKEGFVDTILEIAADKELWVYLSPEIKKTKVLVQLPPPDTVASEIDSTPPVIAVSTNDTDTIEPPTNKFWERQKKLNANIRNIRDTLFSKVSISLVPSISTNKLLSFNTVNNFSFNILIGKSKAVNGFEIGGLVNYDFGDVKYAQVAGLANVVAGDVKYVQVGGIFNSVQGNLDGVQVGGIYNYLKKYVNGVQIGGVFNYASTVYGVQVGGVFNHAKTVYGVQVGGISNFVNDDIYGVQVGGIFNYSQKMSGTQIGGIGNYSKYAAGTQIAGVINTTGKLVGTQIAGVFNAADTVVGTQIAGVANFAKTITGLQIAPFNFADSCTGLPVGIFSFVKSGYHKIEIAIDELEIVSVGFRSGVDRLHNIFFAGYNGFHPQKIWTYGYGLGSYLRFTPKKGLQFDITAQQLQSTRSSLPKLNLLNRFSVNYNYQFAKKFSMAIGPSLSLLVQEGNDAAFNSAFDAIGLTDIVDDTQGGTRLRFWAGARVSIKFL